MAGINRVPPAVGPRNLRRLADGFGMSIAEVEQVLKYVTGGRYPAEKTFVVELDEETPILSSTNLSVRPA